jgi:hypothetical protein
VEDLPVLCGLEVSLVSATTSSVLTAIILKKIIPFKNS